MQANYVQRLRLKFSKSGPTRYIGHLDLARALERALNRAQIPVAYTQGYNPRPRMQFASALPLGFTSEGELADIWLEKEMEPAAARVQMMKRMAPGIVIHDVWEVPLSAPAMQASTLETEYVVTLLDPIDLDELRKRIDALLATDSCLRERRGKEYDLRPLILSLTVEAPADTANDIPAEEGVQLRTRLMLRPGKTGRPDELLSALAIDPLSVRAHRTAIVLEDEARVPERRSASD